MAATVQSSTTTAFASGTSITITKPTGLTVGDLMIFHYVINDATDTIQTLSGWTHEVNNQSSGGIVKTGLQWKIADSGDVAASNFTFASSGTSIQGGGLLRIDDFVVSGLLNDSGNGQANTTSPSYSNTVTPTSANNLLLLFIATNEAGSTSNYAIANDNPTWSEVYDFNSSSPGPQSMACASATRAQTGATGNSSVTLSSSSSTDSYGILVAIESPLNVTVTGSTGLLSLNGNAGTVTGGATVTGSTGVLTLNGNAGTVTIPTPDWTNVDKSAAPNWVNPDKS